MNTLLTSHRFDDNIYPSGPLSLQEVSSNKANNIHDELYEYSLNMLLDNIDKYDYSNDDIKYSNKYPNVTISDKITKDNVFNILEIAADEYWRASDVIIIFKVPIEYDDEENIHIKKYLFIKHRYTLKPYWFSSVQKYDSDSIDPIITKEDISDKAIIKYDYVNGKATFKSRQTDVEYDMDFENLRSSDRVSKELSLPDDLFIMQI